MSEQAAPDNSVMSTHDSLVSDDSAVSEALAQPDESSTSDGEGEYGVQLNEGEPAGSEDAAEPGPEDVDGNVAEVPPEEEAGDEWLPDAQEKQFPIETLARYAERYGYSLEQLQADPNLQRLVTDKINTDVFQRQRETDKAAELSARQAEMQAQRPLTPQEQQAMRQRRDQFIGNIVNQVFDQNAINQLGQDLHAAFGVGRDSLPSWDEEGRAAIDASAPKVGATLARALVDGIQTALPYLLLSPDPNTGQFPMAQMMEHLMPGVSELYERNIYAQSWAQAEQASGVKNLPQYGTQEFVDALTKAGKSIKGFDEIIFKDRSGRELPLHRQAVEKYKLLIKVLSKGGKSGRTGSTKQGKQSGDPLLDYIRQQNKESGF